MKFLVIIEKGAENYSAYSPDVSGCAAAGKSIEETLENISEAFGALPSKKFHFE